MARATESGSLAGWAWDGRDEEAFRILCETASRLHTPRATPSPPLMPLAARFADLAPTAAGHGGIMLNSDARVPIYASWKQMWRQKRRSWSPLIPLRFIST
ncbi:hypothetical protein CFR79_14380 [Komagataeibacter saccharivorans]|nr:hypothetical protein CFR79_14380 [Komagataeibacter saccharivorans]GBQ40874.1 hypothetical protein AA0614_2123 [Komagataeibacter saccharivorans NRIC 0614]